MAKQPKKADVLLTLDQVPAPSSEGVDQPNGDRLVTDGDQIWRYRDDTTLRHYIRLQPGKDRSVTPWRELYEGPRG